MPDEPGIPLGSWIIPVLMLAGAGSFLLWQRQKLTGLPQSTLRVLHRQPIGDRTSVVLLEVPDRDGEVRRLLIGTGPGAPVLLADLGFTEAPREAVPRPEPARAPALAAEARVAPPKAELPKAAPPKPAPRPEPTRTEAPRPIRSAGGNIAQEILAERVKVRPQDNFREEGDYDDPDADPPPPDDDDAPPSPPSPPNRGFSRLLARIGD